MPVPPNLPTNFQAGQIIPSAAFDDLSLAANAVATSGAIPKGPAGGALAGTYPNPTAPGLIPTSQKGQASGVAPLDASSKIDRAYVRMPYYLFSSYGATRNTDASAAWALALADLQAIPGIVHFEGTALTDYWGLPKLILPNRCGIQGIGKRGTRLRLNNGVNSDFVINYQSTGAEAYGRFLTIRDLMLDCNKANQTSGRGIYLANPTPGGMTAGDDDDDNHALIQNVWLANAKNDGFANVGGSEVRLDNVVAFGCDGNGIAPNYDTWVQNCTAEKCGLNGFKLGFGSVGFVNNKAFYNGTVSTASSSVGNGLYIASAGATGGLTASGFRAQDNGTNGVYMEGGGGETNRWIVIQGLICDSNGWGHAGALATPGTYVGLNIWDSQYVQVDGFCSFDRIVNHGAGARVTQSNAVNLAASGAGVGHHIYVTGVHGGMVASQDASMGTPVKAWNKTNVTLSVVTINGTSL